MSRHTFCGFTIANASGYNLYAIVDEERSNVVERTEEYSKLVDNQASRKASGRANVKCKFVSVDAAGDYSSSSSNKLDLRSRVTERFDLSVGVIQPGMTMIGIGTDLNFASKNKTFVYASIYYQERENSMLKPIVTNYMVAYDSGLIIDPYKRPRLAKSLKTWTSEEGYNYLLEANKTETVEVTNQTAYPAYVAIDANQTYIGELTQQVLSSNPANGHILLTTLGYRCVAPNAKITIDVFGKEKSVYYSLFTITSRMELVCMCEEHKREQTLQITANLGNMASSLAGIGKALQNFSRLSIGQ